MRIFHFLAALFFLLCSTLVQAANINFDGTPVADCSLAGTQYTCPSLNGNDNYTIASGYGLTVNSSIAPQWAQQFSMSGTATLTARGNINFNNINSPNLKLTGGSITADGGTFSAGAQNGTVIVANIAAAAITLGGTPVRLTGNMTASGNIDVSYASNLSGNIRAGSASLNSNVTVSGNITTDAALAIGSNSTVSGALKGGAITVSSDVTITQSITADGRLTMGSRTVVSGPVSGATVNADSEVRITGGITSKGELTLASRVAVTGPISGTVIRADSGVNLNGSVTATTSFVMASASTLKGKVTAPVVRFEAESSQIEGDVTALTSLFLGTRTQLKGNVDAGDVTLGATTAYISGTALVKHITLEWDTRVYQTITCKAYTPSNPCSCVTNNSGYPAGSVNGPQCGPGVQSGPHHFQITHPADALSCAPAKVTVMACADAACSTAYTGDAQVTLAPGGAQAQTGSSGSVDSTVSNYAGGTSTLSLTSIPGTTGALVCKNSVDGSNTNCQMNFASSGLQVSGLPRYAEQDDKDKAALTISALQAASANARVCVPLFANQEKTIRLRCSYANPVSGTLPARVLNKDGAYVALASNASSACSATGADVVLKFDANGEARPAMLYADAGQLGISATYTSTSGSDKGLVMTGSGNVIVAPQSFVFTALASPQRAGLAVLPAAPATAITVTALNAKNGVTRNFGRETSEQKVVLGSTLLAPVFAGNSNPAVSGSLNFSNSNGVATASALIWPEAGQMQFTASLQNPYLGSGLQATGSSSTVVFNPHHFVTEWLETGTASAPFPFQCAAPLGCVGGRAVYSRQPFSVRVQARNASDGVTVNFDGRHVAIRDLQVQLQGFDAASGKTAYPPAAPAGSSLTDGALAPAAVTGMPVSAFTAGVATRSLAYSFPTAYSSQQGSTVLAPPTDILLRASYSYGGVAATSAPADQGQEAKLTILSGRVLVPHAYGSEKLPLRLAVQAQYWDGSAWRINLADSISAFGRAQVVLSCMKQLDCSKLQVSGQSFTFNRGELSGNARLVVQSAAVAGSADVSIAGLAYLPSTIGRLVFGIAKSGPVLYLREMY